MSPNNADLRRQLSRLSDEGLIAGIRATRNLIAQYERDIALFQQHLTTARQTLTTLEAHQMKRPPTPPPKAPDEGKVSDAPT